MTDYTGTTSPQAHRVFSPNESYGMRMLTLDRGIAVANPGEWDAERLVSVFRDAGYEAHAKEGYIEVVESGITIEVGLPIHNKFRMRRPCRFIAGVSLIHRLLDVNALTKELTFGRAFLDNDDNPVIEGIGHYSNELSAAHIIESYRRFFDDVDWNLAREEVNEAIIA